MLAILGPLVFFGLIEVILALCGIRPVLYDQDPYVGFTGKVPLFIESRAADGEVFLETAQNKLARFNYQRFPKEKAANTYRTFSLGGSTTYGRPYTDPLSFSGWLREFLSAADPSHDWEVINAGGISYASYRVAALMEELIQFEPDLFIIYSGHNEFLERRTYGDIIDAPRVVTELDRVASHVRIYSLARNFIYGNGKTRKDFEQSEHLLQEDVHTILAQSVGPQAYHRDDPWAEQVMAHYRFNLSRIVDIARSVGAQVIFVTPAGNLKDCAPFKSTNENGLSAEELQRFAQLNEDLNSAFDEARYDHALRLADQALEIDRRFAALHYRRGKILMKLGQASAAREAFLESTKEDVCPLRILPRMRQILADVAARQDVPLLDFDQYISSVSEDGIPGSEYFLEHIHLRHEGYRLLALQLLRVMERERIVATDPSWNEVRIAEVTRKVEAGIDEQYLGHALLNLSRQFSWAGKLEESERLSKEAALLLGDNLDNLLIMGRAAVGLRKYDEAEEDFLRALELKPELAEALNMLGRIHEHKREPIKAIPFYERAIKANASYALPYYNLGNVLLAQGEVDRALVLYRQAIKHKEPTDPLPHYNHARALVVKGLTSEAATEFEAAIHIDPLHRDSHYRLANLLSRLNKHEDAIQHLEQVIKIGPPTASLYLELGYMYNSAGNIAQAQRAFDEALLRQPGWAVPANALAWIYATSGNPKLRDPVKALELAEQAASASQGKDPSVLDTLAAAHAANGDFSNAIRLSEEGIALAETLNVPELALEMRERLELYRQSKPMKQ